MKKNFLLTFFVLLLLQVSAQNKNDSNQIKSLLEKESSTWRSGDVAGHASCWHIQPYSRILVSTPAGKVYDVPASSMITPAANSMGKGGSAQNTDYRFSINKNTAWVSHNEVSTAEDGTKSYSYEIRMLEKIKGQWKLVGQSIHLYIP